MTVRAAIAHDFSQNPMLVYWEMTQACALACRHCRAEAMSKPHPLELNHEESKNLLRQIAAFGEPLPHLILTGGDPLMRADLFDLIGYATALGLQVSIAPSATQNLTREVIARLKAHGIGSLGLSLDGSTAARHEAMRGMEGCFAWTIGAARAAAELDLPIQINTLVASETAEDLPAIYELIKALKVMRWSLFFLIPIGRGRLLQEVSPDRGEELMNWLYDLSRVVPFGIKTTEAPFYRRIALSRMRRDGLTAEQIRRTSLYQGFGIRDGRGIIFVSHMGEVYPSGFLPVAAGDVRRSSAVEIYRNSELFISIRDTSRLKGKCGRCEFKAICGGSRARAYAHTGDYLESDPLCPYQPPRHHNKYEPFEIAAAL